MLTWMTVDSDDFRHLPKHQGHPTRSKGHVVGNEQLSPTFRAGWSGFLRWMEEHDGAVTLFVISDMLHDVEFAGLLTGALKQFPQRLTVGCHGHTHRSWSAWGEDAEGFNAMLSTSTQLLREHVGEAFRPFFRAPSGYVAPWMAAVLNKNGYTVDTSVNPSWLVRRKAGGSSWSAVNEAMAKQRIVERPWLTRNTLPVNGPALFTFPLSVNAKTAWKRAPRLLRPDELSKVERREQSITTLYCHILDFARRGTTWTPPLRHRAK